MKNTILNFEKTEYEGMIVSDYFSKEIKINDIYYLLEPFVEKYMLTNNMTYESLSYELYKTTDYWDLLYLLNNKDPLFDNVYDYDLIEKMTQEFVDRYRNIYSHAPLFSGRINAMYSDYLIQNEKTNESNRAIYIISPPSMSNVITILNEKGYI